MHTWADMATSTRVCVHASCSCTARGLQLKRAFHATHTQSCHLSELVCSHSGLSRGRVQHEAQHSLAQQARLSREITLHRDNKSPHFATSQLSGFVAGTQNNKPSSTAKCNAAGGEATCQTRALSLPRDTVLATRFAFDRDGRGCNTLHAQRASVFLRAWSRAQRSKCNWLEGRTLQQNKRQRMRSSKPHRESQKNSLCTRTARRMCKAGQSGCEGAVQSKKR
jgi:hypothetical protein